jgi:hypothetical protein
MKRDGFTLPEVLIVVLLANAVFFALIRLSSMLISGQIKNSNALRAQGESLLALKAISGRLVRASQVYSPASAAAGDVLEGCINYDPVTNLVDPSKGNESFHFCLDAGNLYLHALKAPSPAAPVACPMPAPASCNTGTLVGSLLANLVFSRAANNQNLVQVRFDVIAGQEERQEKISIDTAVSIQARAGAAQ